MQRNPRQRSETHLHFIRQLPCLICGDNTSTEAAHLRMPDRAIAKPLTGTSIKPDDRFTLPLCNRHHAEQHQMGEATWWLLQGIEPIKVALALWSVDQDYERGMQIIAANCKHVHA